MLTSLDGSYYRAFPGQGARKSLVCGLLGCLTLLSAGCGSGSGMNLTGLNVSRLSWDTVMVSIGSAGLAPAGPIVVTILDSAFDTLYTGPPGKAVIDDRGLGDEELVLVEVCGTFDDVQVCEQESMSASPKRITIEQSIDYPDGVRYDRGRYRFETSVDRRRFGQSDLWEKVEEADVSRLLVAYVDGAEQERVSVPISRNRGRFDLARADNYRDFKFSILTALMDDQEARVTFDFYAGLGGELIPLATSHAVIESKTMEVRELEVEHYVEVAVPILMRRLGDDPSRGDRYAYLNGWTFRQADRTYVIEIDVAWRESSFGRGLSRMSGRLEVHETTMLARFVVGEANRRARRSRERAEIGGAVDLGTLSAPTLRGKPATL